MNRNIIDTLKNDDFDIRVTNDRNYSWLVWDNALNQWAVFQKKPYERRTGCLYHGDYLDEAVGVLIGET